MKRFITENFCKTKPKLRDNKPRIEFIDLAKGVCIIMVVVFHAGFAKNIPAINAMRMPLYFILSGLFFKDYGGFFNLLYKKANKILVPFCFFTILYLIPAIFKYSQHIILSVFIDPIFAPQVVNYPIWFLICLFLVNIIYYSIQKYFADWIVKSIVVILFGFSGFLLSYYNIYIPFFLGSAFSALPYFYIGVLLKRTPILYKTTNDKIYFGVIVTLMLISVAYCIAYGTPILFFRTNRYEGNLFGIYIISITLVLGLLLLCKAVGWLPIVSYFGRYSIIVLGLHALYLDFATIPLSYFTSHEFSDLEKFALTLLLCWLSIPILKKYLPSLTAQTDLLVPRSKSVAQLKERVS